jgi:hypothetical protein
MFDGKPNKKAKQSDDMIISNLMAILAPVTAARKVPIHKKQRHACGISFLPQQVPRLGQICHWIQDSNQHIFLKKPVGPIAV